MVLVINGRHRLAPRTKESVYLSCVAAGREGVTVREIARLRHLAKAKVEVRITELLAVGLVEQVPAVHRVHNGEVENLYRAT